MCLQTVLGSALALAFCLALTKRHCPWFKPQSCIWLETPGKLLPMLLTLWARNTYPAAFTSSLYLSERALTCADSFPDTTSQNQTHHFWRLRGAQPMTSPSIKLCRIPVAKSFCPRPCQCVIRSLQHCKQPSSLYRATQAIAGFFGVRHVYLGGGPAVPPGPAVSVSAQPGREPTAALVGRRLGGVHALVVRPGRAGRGHRAGAAQEGHLLRPHQLPLQSALEEGQNLQRQGWQDGNTMEHSACGSSAQEELEVLGGFQGNKNEGFKSNQSKTRATAIPK